MGNVRYYLWRLFRLAAVLFAVVCMVGLQVAAQVVDIPDAGLKAAIRKALAKPVGDISVADMESLTTLDASVFARGPDAPPIGSLEGLQTARNLTGLNLMGIPFQPPTKTNLVTGDLSSLAGLTNLQTLNLSWNELAQIYWPTGLTSLTSLNLQRDPVSDFSFVSGLTNLTSLNVGYNQLRDCSFVGGLTNLRSLDLGVNQLSDCSSLHALTGLTNLSLTFNPITECSFLSGLTNLISLSLIWNQLTNCSCLGGLTKLTTLVLEMNPVGDFSFLAGLTNLTFLDLESDNYDLVFTLPASLTNLTQLNLPPAATFVLPEVIAPHVFPDIDFLRSNWGDAVYLYPLETRLAVAQPTVAGVFALTFTGPPGSYRVQVTSDLLTWTDVGSVTNIVGAGKFTDSSASQRREGFYRIAIAP